MERKLMKVAISTVLASTLVGGFVSAGPASATTTAQANAEYAAAIAGAKANFLAAVKPSQAALIASGKRAEAVRRAAVKQALTTFNAVVAQEKAQSLAAEKTYKTSVAASLASPTNLTLKATVKTNLAALTAATTALKSDAKIATARAVFAKSRTAAMEKFKASLVISAKQRTLTLDRASARYKATKAKALANLKRELKKATK